MLSMRLHVETKNWRFGESGRAPCSSSFDRSILSRCISPRNGYDVISHAKQKQPIKGVALTGFDKQEDIERSKQAGFDFHLTKLVDFAELRTVLGQLS